MPLGFSRVSELATTASVCVLIMVTNLRQKSFDNHNMSVSERSKVPMKLHLI